MTDQLDLEKTYSAILNAARERHCISYGDLAKANNVEWSKVRYKINQHLDDLIKIADAGPDKAGISPYGIDDILGDGQLSTINFPTTCGIFTTQIRQ